MSVVINILIIIASILLVLIVLVQNSKGGGLASNFSSSNQILGVRRTTDFLEKATWTLAIALVCLCLISNLVGRGTTVETGKSAIEEKIGEQAPVPQNMPTAPETGVPQQE